LSEGRAAYLDLLVTTLMEHEKELDQLVERLGEIVNRLSEISAKVPPEKCWERRLKHGLER